MNFQDLVKNPSKKGVAFIFIIIGLFFILKPYFVSKKVVEFPSENTENTKNWKVYDNDKYRFSFKYPDYLLSNFHIQTNIKSSQTLNEMAKLNLRKVKNPNEYNVIFEADAWRFNGTLEEFIDKNLPETKGLEKIKIILGKFEGLRISNIDVKSNAYFQYNLFNNNNYIYNFAILSDEAILIGGNSKLLENIITTTKFY